MKKTPIEFAVLPRPGQLWPEVATGDVFDDHEDLPRGGDDEANEVLFTRFLRRAS